MPTAEMAYRRANSEEADRIARKYRADGKVSPAPSWSDLRNFCDFATDQDMTCVQLDRLTDMVERRLEREA